MMRCILSIKAYQGKGVRVCFFLVLLDANAYGYIWIDIIIEDFFQHDGIWEHTKTIFIEDLDGRPVKDG